MAVVASHVGVLVFVAFSGASISECWFLVDIDVNSNSPDDHTSPSEFENGSGCSCLLGNKDNEVLYYLNSVGVVHGEIEGVACSEAWP